MATAGPVHVVRLPAFLGLKSWTCAQARSSLIVGAFGAVSLAGCVGGGNVETVGHPQVMDRLLDAEHVSEAQLDRSFDAATSEDSRISLDELPAVSVPITVPSSVETLPETTISTTTSTSLVPSDQLELEQIDRLTGDLASKSIVASGHGLFFAQNMMYRHTITVFDRDEELVATIDDSIDLSDYGVEVDPGTYQGAPVEAAFSPDGRYGYVSNYRMYGPGFASTASDNCNKGEGQNSFVYRVDTKLIGSGELPIDRVFEVGSVPKFVAVTPNNQYLLVTNWCTFDLSVIDLETERLVASIPLGRHPRGIAVSSDSLTAYATVMGGSEIAVVDLDDLGTETEWIRSVGQSPRHLVLSPDDATLYATLNGEGTVIKIDVATGEVTDRVRTGIAPRSMAISDDGLMLYVVNYESNTMTSVRTSDFEILQTFKTAHHPIGITFDIESREVWVSAYSGVIHVFAERQQ